MNNQVKIWALYTICSGGAEESTAQGQNDQLKLFLRVLHTIHEYIYLDLVRDKHPIFTQAFTSKNHAFPFACCKKLARLLVKTARVAPAIQ